MRTTIEIADPLFERARRHAEREGTTLRALVEEGLRQVLAQKTGTKPFKLRDVRFTRGGGLTPEFANVPFGRIRRASYGDYDDE